MTTLGDLRAYWLGAVVCMGGFLFGYDSGIIGGVMTFSTFENDFNFTKKQKTRISSLCVSLQQLGAFVACFFVIPFTAKFGRKKAILLSSFTFCIGAMLQTVPSHSLSCFYVGRVIAGLGLGTMTYVVPMFNAEMSPTHLRARLGSFFQFFYTLGVFTSYWIDYGVQENMADSGSKQWQIPVGLQILFAGLLGIGVLTLRESTRWLANQDRYEEAWESLVYMRADESEKTALEMAEIRASIQYERQARAGLTISEFLSWPVLKRIIGGFTVFLAQQATGATATAYYAPQYFSLLTNGSEHKSLLLSGIFGAVKVFACGLFVWLAADRWSRKSNLTIGALGMSACLIVVAAVLKTRPAPSDGSIPGSSKAMVALLYLFVMVYNFSWGPLPWPYVNELYSIRHREVGVAIAVSSQWLWNFVFTVSTPYMIDSMGWGTFLLWGLFDLVIAAGTFFFAHETKGLTLEEAAHPELFHDDLAAAKLDQNQGRGVSSEGKGVGTGKGVDAVEERTLDGQGRAS
ncbi:MFS sugar transporter-like protein [Phyllosticta citricarpa]|uniref:MFS sugar transporter-like protein n=1 Tax=Phyllosticta citricarpa TaxID=55181 RepID=A0ABR1M620_9PEZI